MYRLKWILWIWIGTLFPLICLEPLEYIQSLPVELLGLTPSEAWNRVGPPLALESLEKDQGYPVVMTIHERGLQLFWFENRLWQMSFQEPWDEPIWGIELSMDVFEILELMEPGAPIMQNNDLLIFQMPDIGFPTEARFYFDDQGTLQEFLFYRSDF